MRENERLKSSLDKQEQIIEQFELKVSEMKRLTFEMTYQMRSQEERCSYLESQLKSMKEANKFYEEKYSRNMDMRMSSYTHKSKVTGIRLSKQNSLLDIELNNLGYDMPSQKTDKISLNSFRDEPPMESHSHQYSTHLNNIPLHQFETNHIDIQHLNNLVHDINPYPEEEDGLFSLIENQNKCIQQTFNHFQGKELTDLFKDMPKLDPTNTTSYEQFSFTLIKQQEFLLNQIINFQKMTNEIHTKYKDTLGNKLQRAMSQSSFMMCNNCSNNRATKSDLGYRMQHSRSYTNKPYLSVLKDRPTNFLDRTSQA